MTAEIVLRGAEAVLFVILLTCLWVILLGSAVNAVLRWYLNRRRCEYAVGVLGEMRCRYRSTGYNQRCVLQDAHRGAHFFEPTGDYTSGRGNGRSRVTTDADQIAACPTPEYHQTHRYCPSCPWTEALNRPQCLALLEHATNPSLSWKCEDYQGHPGDHSRVLPGYKTPTKLVWGG